MTKRQEEIIRDNLKAFVHNFGEPRIEQQKPFPGFYVYLPADSESCKPECVQEEVSRAGAVFPGHSSGCRY